jgi:hypothetical protein
VTQTKQPPINPERFTHDDVAALVSGPVFICNECHALMAPIMARATPPAPERAVVKTALATAYFHLQFVVSRRNPVT